MDADVVVIGAGAAGLAAARSLAGRSRRVMLLEARDRVGGRAWSRPIPGKSTPAELGAEFIHGQAELTMSLLREARIAGVDTAGEGWVCTEDADLRRNDWDWPSIASVFDAVHTLANDESVDQFLRRFEGDGATRATARAARAFVEGFDAADPAIASVRGISDEWQSGVDFATARPVGGYGPMFGYLRDACAAAGVQSCLSTIVRRISWRRGAVTIDASCCGEPRTIHARTAVLTLPVGVLRRTGDDTAVVFDPDLPPATRAALRKIEMGHVVKVTLWFRTAFWERVRKRRYRDAAFFRCDAEAFPTYWTQLPVRSELIVAWVGGPRAIALDSVTEADVIQRALDGLGRMFRDPALVRKEFEGGLTYDWNRDPFTRGAYSYLTVGAGDARAMLAAPVHNTLFFAGEATSTDNQSGTVNGALATGARAAREVAMVLDAEAPQPDGG